MTRNIHRATNCSNTGRWLASKAKRQAQVCCAAGKRHYVKTYSSLSESSDVDKAQRHTDRGDRQKDYLSSCNYGFNSGSSGMYTNRDGPTTPSNVADLALKNFKKEWEALKSSTELALAEQEMSDSGYMEEQAIDDTGLLGSIQDDELCLDLQMVIQKLTLDADAIWQRELSRLKEQNKKSNIIIRIPYVALCWLLDRVFGKNEPIQRFWFLETVARMPYFSYISMLHLYETLGWWRRAAAVKRVHFAEEWNEFHHLLIMESLGGDQQWKVRFMANHAAILYYWVLNALWLVSPALAYGFSELIELHAVDTYTEFLESNADLLKSLPAPSIAVQYYQSDDLYMFDEFQTSRRTDDLRRRPIIKTLHDTFINIRDDEMEHVKTMLACQKEGRNEAVQSPHQF